jgi:photosystem II stability/assembly factor-like uncharacterized protein
MNELDLALRRLPPATAAEKVDRLYHLLPAIYRIRDEEQGGQLRALLAIVESELDSIEGDIEDLYENWFIETCADWVVPYIGDLLAVRDLNVASPRTDGQERRAYVANTLAYRQRKGTTPVLEQLARDITGWGARAVEALPLLATTQHLDRPRTNGTVSLRNDRRPERLGTPFANIKDGVSYTTAIQRGINNPNRYNPASVNLYLWRLQSYPIEWGTARAILAPQGVSGYYFTFNPLGYAAPLFNQPQTETELIQLAEEINLPGILTVETLRTVLDRFLESHQETKEYLHYFGRQPVLEVKIDGVKPANLQFDNLQWEAENWQPPQPTANCSEDSSVIVDPESGRLVLLQTEPPDCVQVSYAYGFSGDIGGGPYERPSIIPDTISPSLQLIWNVSLQPPAADSAPAQMSSLSQAVKTWNKIAQTWQKCDDLTYIPLARLAIDDNGQAQILQPTPGNWHSQWHPQLRSGILAGLEVIAEIGDLEATVMPGVAVDGQGQAIRLNIRQSSILGDYPNRQVWLVISDLPRAANPRWQIEIVPVELENQYPIDRYIRLAQLELDANGRIKSIERTVTMFSSGIIRGLNVSLSSSDRSLNINVSAAPGMAVNRQGQVLTIDRDISASLVDLLDRDSLVQTPADLQNRLVILFLIPGDRPKLGAVLDADIGVIRLWGNTTVAQNLSLKIPARKRLYLLAGNGDRPHLQGNIFIAGIATANRDGSGEFWLDGLLLEGQLVVSPGNLKQLQIGHSTLVPLAGGLVVEKPADDTIDEDPTDLTLLAMLMYSLTLFQRLLKVGLGNNTLSPQQRIDRITDITLKQMRNAIGAVHHTIEQWQHPATPPQTDPDDSNCSTDEIEPPRTNFEADNGQLKITIDRSICGPIALADTVPSLNIVDSIIDPGLADGLVGAIAAAGTATEIHNTTILGTTIARSLSASNSIFTDRVVTLRQQVGCLRFCYVPVSSHTPPRYRCQPDLLLAERINTPLAAITTLTFHSTQLFLSTAGNGVFYYDSNPDRQIWIPLNLGLDLPHVTALVVVPPPGSDAAPFLLAATLGGMLFKAPVPDLSSGIGTITSRGTKVKGQGTSFLTEMTLGETIVVARQSRIVVGITSNSILQIDRPLDRDLLEANPFLINRTHWTPVQTTLNVVRLGTGKISTEDPQPNPSATGIRGFNTRFSQEISTSDKISVQGQIRSVREILSDTRLELDRPFETNIVGESFQIIKAYPNQPLTNNLITTLMLDERESETSIWATTAGNGVFRSTDGQQWTTANYGLTDLDVRSIAIDPRTHQIFVGTHGGGVFWSTDRGNSWQGGDPADPEIRQSGLTDPYITAVTINPYNGHIFAATNSGIFRSTDGGEHWAPVNQGLKNPQITALTHDSRSTPGTIVTADRQITFSEPESIASLPDGNYTIIANGQTRMLTLDRQNPHQLIQILNDAFDPDLSAPTPFNFIDLFAGTNDGRVFRSTDEGQSWREIGNGLTNTEITTLTCLPFDGKRVLFVGTRIGSVFYLQNNKNWLALNTGLDRVDAALAILNQIRPDFTSIQYGQPGYAQLRNTCPPEIYTGAEDGSEMGAFSYLKQPQRSANLQASLTEYLRFGLQANIIYIT